MRNDVILLVVTSEGTWQMLPKYCFNQNFVRNRNRFDLGVVMNGPSREGFKYIKEIGPEYLYIRPNYGLDPAGFDFLLKHVELSYERYILLHDDHWFEQPDWFDRINALMEANPEVDIWGNLVNVDYCNLGNFPVISEVLGYPDCSQDHFPFFLQGMSGVFKRNPIERLFELDGIPHIHRNIKKVGEVCERLFSFILLAEGYRFEQLPPGYEKFLRHRDI